MDRNGVINVRRLVLVSLSSSSSVISVISVRYCEYDADDEIAALTLLLRASEGVLVHCTPFLE